jgi:hypothetical protein
MMLEAELKGDDVIVDVDGDTLRGITVDIEDALTSMMEWKRGGGGESGAVARCR